MKPRYAVEQNGSIILDTRSRTLAMRLYETVNGWKRLLYRDDYGQVVVRKVIR